MSSYFSRIWGPFVGFPQEVSLPNMPPVNHLTVSYLNALSTGPKAVTPSHQQTNGPDSSPSHHSSHRQSSRRLHMCLQRHQTQLVKALMVLNDNLPDTSQCDTTNISSLGKKFLLRIYLLFAGIINDDNNDITISS